MLAPPWIEVPPQAYGGIESVVALLCDGLVRRGARPEGDDRCAQQVPAQRGARGPAAHPDRAEPDRGPRFALRSRQGRLPALARANARGQGPHRAIDAARLAGIRVLLAGPV